jgi:biotin operon repressor
LNQATLKLGDTRLIFLKNDKGQPSSGRALDHLGFSFADLNAKMKELEAQGVKFTTEPRPLKLASGTMVNVAYLEGPAGAKIELVQR